MGMWGGGGWGREDGIEKDSGGYGEVKREEKWESGKGQGEAA